MAGDRLVRKEHELLDEAMRDVPLGRNDASISPYSDENDFGLREIEIDRAAAAPSGIENLEQLAHQLEQRHERLVLRDGRGVVVGQDRVDRV